LTVTERVVTVVLLPPMATGVPFLLQG